jgi:serine/threonine protein kinase
MNAERLERLEQIFHGALEQPEGPARNEFLARQCGGDEDLHSWVLMMLKADSGTEPASTEPAGQDQDVLPRFGAFQAERVLGRGGAGIVYLCRRTEPGFEQFAAVKLIRSPLGHFDRSFLRERRVLAALRHPGIATLIDAGRQPDGSPYLVMEYVEGLRLDHYCRDRRLNLAERLALFRSMCSAVSYAHRRLVAHLDIKPSNVLVTSEGQSTLLDFGTAKILGAEDAAATQSFATPRYASPEQLRGENAGPLADIYSLGVVLAELLTGQWPFGDPRRRLESLRRAVEDLEPGPLAPLIDAEQAASCRSTVRQLQSAVNGDLTAIVHKAMRSDPEQRYHSVEQLAHDIECYLQSRPVSARRASRMDRARKLIKRHPWNTAFATLFIVGMTAASLFSMRQAEIARKQAARAGHISSFLSDLLGSPNSSWYNTLTSRGRNITMVEVLGQMTQRLGRELSGEPDVEVELRRIAARMYAVIGEHDSARTQVAAAISKQLTIKNASPLETAKLYITRATEEYFTIKNEEALADGRQALAFLQRVDTAKDRGAKQARMEAFNVVGVSALSLGMLSEAEHATAEALRLSRELFGNGGSTPVNLATVGAVYHAEGKWSAARSVYQEVLGIFRSQVDKHGEAALALRDLGLLCLDEGDYRCANEYLGPALAQAEEQFGPASSYTILLLAAKGAALGGLHHFSEGMAELREARERMIKAAGADSLAVTEIDVQYGMVQFDSGDFRSAESTLRKVYERYQRSYRDTDPRLLAVESRLGECLLAMGRRDQALPLLTESYTALKQKFGEDHIFTQRAKSRLEKAH